jgi:DNA-binding transcriptional regulator YdaS (Cro superfamily)
MTDSPASHLSRLEARLTEHGIRPTELARRIGYSPSYLFEVLTGRKGCPIDMATAIERETGIEMPELRAMRERVARPAQESAA